MVSVLLVQPRDREAVAAAEIRDVINATELNPEELTSVLLDSENSRLPDLDGFDGVIVGGSPLNVTSLKYSPWQKHVHRQLHTIAQHAIPTIFICFGTPLLTQLDGGSIGRTYPEESGPTTVLLTEDGKRDVLTRDLPLQFTSFTGHTENIVTPAPSHKVLATGATCPVQMVRINRTTWGVQFHADMDDIAMKDRMDFYSTHGYFSPEKYTQIVAGLPSVNTVHANRLLKNFVEVCQGLRPSDGAEHSTHLG